MFKRLLAALTLLASIPANAQTINKPKLDSLFNLLAANDRAMISVAISQNGKVLYTNAIGYSDLEHKVKSTPKTLYRIGSITKMFTASLIMKAIEEKKTSMTAPLSTWFPTIPNASTITVGMMLGHRSGLHSFTDDPDYISWVNQHKTQDELVKKIAGATPEFTPDSTSAYSNANYVLLGFIVEKLNNKPYKEVLQEKILKPANIKETFFSTSLAFQKGEAFSYRYADKWLKEESTDMSIPGGAGAIVSTPSDLTKFSDALFGGKIISQASLELMKVQKDHFGLGMLTFPFGKRTFYGHTGGIDGFSSLLGRNLEDGLTIAYSSNGTRYSNNDITIGIMCIFYNLPYELPSFKTYAVKPEELDQYTGIYATTAIPLKLTITKKGGSLMAQATGQPEFPLEAIAKDKFKFEAAKVTIEFNPATKELTLKQGGGSYLFKKEITE